MSQCYLGSEPKTSMKKLYFEVFIANYFYTFNKKDPVLLNSLKVAKSKHADKVDDEVGDEDGGWLHKDKVQQMTKQLPDSKTDDKNRKQ